MAAPQMEVLHTYPGQSLSFPSQQPYIILPREYAIAVCAERTDALQVITVFFRKLLIGTVPVPPDDDVAVIPSQYGIPLGRWLRYLLLSNTFSDMAVFFPNM
jgi:hypothetical protein